jgi:hypothetical protein
MKRILGLMLSMSVMLVACSVQDHTTLIPKKLLSDEEGKYRFLVVHPEGDGFKNPTFMRELDNLEQVLTGGSHTFLENAQRTYVSLRIEKAPYFIFFDTKQIVFETDKESEAYSFIKEKLNEK